MFQAHEIAMQLIVAVRPIVEAVRPHDKNLAEQLRRAATSAAANTAEGGRRITRDRLHAFRVASAEAAEALSHARIAVAWGLRRAPRGRCRPCRRRDELRRWLQRPKPDQSSGPMSRTAPGRRSSRSGHPSASAWPSWSSASCGQAS